MDTEHFAARGQCSPVLLWHGRTLIQRADAPRETLPGAGRPVGPRPAGGRLSSACVLPTAAGEPRAVVVLLWVNNSHLPQTAHVLASGRWSPSRFGPRGTFGVKIVLIWPPGLGAPSCRTLGGRRRSCWACCSRPGSWGLASLSLRPFAIIRFT